MSTGANLLLSQPDGVHFGHPHGRHAESGLADEIARETSVWGRTVDHEHFAGLNSPLATIVPCDLDLYDLGRNRDVV